MNENLSNNYSKDEIMEFDQSIEAPSTQRRNQLKHDK